MNLFAKLLVGGTVVMAVLAATGASYQWVAAGKDRARYPAPGRLVAVDGLRLHLDCRGSGRPVVILEAGLTSGSTSWALVHDAMSQHTEVCAYDRPGMDWSEPGDGIALAGEVAERLHALLEAAAIDGPYVLVGMSAGGIYVREFIKRHPDGVVGMVLVDSSHEQQGQRLPQFENTAGMERMLHLCTWLQPLGVVRLSGALDTVVEQYPESIRAAARANANQSHTCRSTLAEAKSIKAQLAVATAPLPLRDLPLIVLSQGAEPKGIPQFGVTDEQARTVRTVWDVLQQELTALSSRGRQVIARESGHLIQLQQPQLVIDSVAELVRELRGAGAEG